MYEAEVLADSVPFGRDSEELASVSALHKHPDRLITVKVTFPRFILAEVNTHRVFSRNSASSRAIPPEQMIRRVEEEPFVPETFNKRVKGMGVGEELEEHQQAECRRLWIEAAEAAIAQAKGILHYETDKSRVNRLLEPFLWHTAIITSSRWENFFALRNHPAAQPEFQILVAHMLRAMQASYPEYLGPGEWHLPMVSPDEKVSWTSRFANEDPALFWARVSAGRCARVSYDTQDNYEEPEKSYERQVERLEKNGHLSPAEHVATPEDLNNPDLSRAPIGNLGPLWVTLRGLIPHEDNLVGKLEDKPHWYEADPVVPLEVAA